MQTRQKVREILIIISFLLFPMTLYYFSPYLIVDGTVKGIISGSFIVFSLQFISSLFLGRAFCGWVCPAAGIQEILIKYKNRKITKGNFIKWIIWLPWLAIIVLLAFKNGGYNKVDPFYQTTHGISVGDLQSIITYFAILALIVIPAFLVGKRAFCHTICWMAPFMIIGRKLRNVLNLPSLQLISKTDICSHCHTCTTKCPMSLPVEEMVQTKKMERSECILCGTCVDGCKSKSIMYDFNSNKKHHG